MLAVFQRKFKMRSHFFKLILILLTVQGTILCPVCPDMEWLNHQIKIFGDISESLVAISGSDYNLGDDYVKFLLDQGADVNYFGADHDIPGKKFFLTALHKAASAGRLSTVKLLLLRGADPLLKSITPLCGKVTALETVPKIPDYDELRQILSQAESEAKADREIAKHGENLLTEYTEFPAEVSQMVVDYVSPKRTRCRLVEEE